MCVLQLVYLAIWAAGAGHRPVAAGAAHAGRRARARAAAGGRAGGGRARRGRHAGHRAAAAGRPALARYYSTPAILLTYHLKTQSHNILNNIFPLLYGYINPFFINLFLKDISSHVYHRNISKIKEVGFK